MVSFKTEWLGRVPYEDALALQDAKAAARRKEYIPDTLLLLEHDPVYTIGRTRERRSLAGDPSSLPHPVFEISRGGQATYHGPGQLVGYAIVDLKRYLQDLHAYLRTLEQSLVSLCAEFGLDTHLRDPWTGVWVEDRKLASIGVGVRHWITMHGFALNVCNDLSPFQAIIPCGIDGVRMTSLAEELPGQNMTVEAIAAAYPEHLGRALRELRKA